ncbi:hypothetical protein KSP40_PGU018533 [Platanthera guangdongensis]|uniref:Uncharacterized protein n=1 Tax=Platanthera guangdongensis TaxID=2320717 RepID=A0ABR2LGW8_9ASPA
MESGRVNKKPSASQKPKTSASSTAKQRVQEIYTPRDLVGSIVEKGFSSSSPTSNPQKTPIASFPQPTVLSFPVAHHRSHTPHWNPLHAAPEFKENVLADDMDETDYAPISAFAIPIERKEKKSLDFSSWKGLVSGGDSNSTSYQPNKKQAIPSEEKKKTVSARFPCRNDEALKESPVAVKRAKPSSDMVCQNGESGVQFSQSNGLELATVVENLSINGKETHMLMSSTQGFGSTMDDIHAENSARLNLMSSQEIADAQLEIIEKMNPAVIEMLKKRGRDKLGNMKSSDLEQDNCGLDSQLPEACKNRGNDNVGSELSSGSLISSKMTAMHPDCGPAGQEHSSNWTIWSERVEKVRELRFSLEGNAMVVDSYQISNGCEAERCRPDMGNAAERDFLRTEGDPAALGYSIKEVIELIRSMVPAQRALALKLLDSILNKALFNLLNAKDEPSKDSNHVDWQAIWAYALGPEPQLVLSLRIALDDNHHSVVLACAKVIRCMLSCDMNENYFNVSERVPAIQKVLCTAPVFRSRPEIDSGFLQGGFWKYSTKPSNILPSSVDDNDGEEERTIQDDVVVAGQDISAGFVRMGILPRICYLLEMEPIPALVESLLSVLIGLARHSPTCANAIIQCPRLIQNVVNILTRQGMMELACQIKAITMIKVLSQMDKHLCSNFVKDGVFQRVMWHWYRSPITLDQWGQYGKEHCKLTAALMVEQLRLWKVFISYGYCVAYFTDFFLHMCLWLSRPTFNKLLELNILDEFAHVTGEAFLTLGALAEWLPCLHSKDQLNKQGTNLGGDNIESWSWSHVVPVVDIAIHWLTLKDIPYVLSTFHCINENNIHNSASGSMIWVISAVLHMLCCVFDRISPPSSDDGNDSTSLPWLPEFVPKVGIEIVKNHFFSFNDSSGARFRDMEGYSLVQRLCYLNHQDNFDVSLSSLSCLHGLVRLASSVDKCIERARNACDIQLLTGIITEMDDKVLVDGIIKCAEEDLTRELNVFGNLVSYKWPMVQSLEIFGRGGPAPGVGVGWGSLGGSFWSLSFLQLQTAARLVVELIQILKCVHERDQTSVESMEPTLQRVNWALAICLVAGPGDRAILEGALSILFQPHVLKHLSFFLHRFLHLDKR